MEYKGSREKGAREKAFQMDFPEWSTIKSKEVVSYRCKQPAEVFLKRRLERRNVRSDTTRWSAIRCKEVTFKALLFSVKVGWCHENFHFSPTKFSYIYIWSVFTHNADKVSFWCHLLNFKKARTQHVCQCHRKLSHYYRCRSNVAKDTHVSQQRRDNFVVVKNSLMYRYL